MCFLQSSVATDGKDGQRLKLDKGGQTFSSFIVTPTRIPKNAVIVSAS